MSVPISAVSIDPRLAAIAARFLHYSFSPINYNYDNLTETEQSLCTRDEFDALVAWVETTPKPDGIEEGPAT